MRRSGCSSPWEPCWRSSSLAAAWEGQRGAVACSWPSCPASLPLSWWRRSAVTRSRLNCARRYRITRCPTHWRRSRRCPRSCSTCSVHIRVKRTITTGCAATSCPSTTTASWMPCALWRTLGWSASLPRWYSVPRHSLQRCTESAQCRAFRYAPSSTSCGAARRGWPPGWS
jgi:hypothetical protein